MFCCSVICSPLNVRHPYSHLRAFLALHLSEGVQCDAGLFHEKVAVSSLRGLSGHSWEGWLCSFSPQPHQILPQVQQLSRSIYNKWVILSLDLIDKIIVLCSYIDLWWKLTNWTFKTTWSNLSVVFKAFARKPDVFLYILQNRKSHVHKNSGHSELVELIPCCSKTALMQTAALHNGRCPLNSGH